MSRVIPRVRLAFLTPTLLMGGAERWLVSLARRCDRERIEWTGTALTEGAAMSPALGRELSSYMPIFGGPGAGGNGAPYIRRCRSAREALDCVVADADVLITWGTQNLAELLADLPSLSRRVSVRPSAALRARVASRRLPVVLVSHGGGEWAARTVQTSESGASHFVAVSEPALTPFSPTARERAVIIHNGVDVERCTPTTERAETRAAWGFDDRHVLIGFVGRYSWEKNPLAAARAAVELGGNYRAVYAGEGWAEVGLRQEVAAIAGSRATFVPPDRNTGNLFSALDVFVLASPSEGFSLALAEAWYCGIPAVATRVGAIPELEQIHGPLVSAVPVDPLPRDLAAALEHALSPEFRCSVVPQAQEAVCRHYTAGAMAARWTEYLCSLCAAVAV